MSTSSDEFFKSNILGHPSGLFVLFFTEMWERFSYYGMRALLVLFLTASVMDEGWGWPREHAFAIFGTYTALVYLSTMMGGYFADKKIGYRWAVVVGAVLMTLGHGAMALETQFFTYTGLTLLVFGSGFFKPNMTSIISEMYKDRPEKKDGAYTIFYMGVNAGAFLGILLCGYLGEKVGWSIGFGLAGIFMLFGTIQFWMAQNIFGDVGKKPKKLTKEENRALLGDESIKKLMNIKYRQTAAAGGEFKDVYKSLKGTAVGDALGTVNSDEYQAAEEAFEGAKAEVIRMKERIAALNLGLRDMTSATAATALGMDNLMNRFTVGSLQVEDSFNVLMASATEAGAHINDADFNAALGNVERSMKAFGASDKDLKRFTDGLKATHIVQSQTKKIFNEAFIKKLNEDMVEGKTDESNPAALREKFGNAIVAQLPEELRDTSGKQLQKLIETGAISNEDMERFQSGKGDMSVITKLIEDLVKNQQGILKTHQERLMKFNKQLITVTKMRIDSERKFIAAQKTAIDMQMEAREIASKYGGAEFGTGEKRKLLLEKANVGAKGMGIQDLQGGGLGEIRRRNAQIGMNYANIERRGRTSDQRGFRVAGGGAGAVAVDERQKDLMKANKDHATLIRSLIKLEEEELQILEKKNALEKESLSSLMKGDLEGFLKQQAAVGATAAIATGDKGMMGMFGPDALAGAFENMKKQQEGGVQTLFGQKLGGAGGLVERGAFAALSSRGMPGQQAAQRAAGTTPEEEAQKRKIRGLAGALSETGDVGAGMAGMKVKTAEMRVDLANIEIRNLAGAVVGLQAKAGGGLIYANNGMFVPRGTDTVPAMLTPGEFVVRRQAVQRGNNLQMLQAMNGGDGARFQSGGQVGYYSNGSGEPVGAGGGGGGVGLDPAVVANLAISLSMFNSGLADNIQKLKDIQFQIKLDTTNINVTLNGASFLASLSGALKSELMVAIGEKIRDTGFNSDGSMMAATGPLNVTEAVG